MLVSQVDGNLDSRDLHSMKLRNRLSWLSFEMRVVPIGRESLRCRRRLANFECSGFRLSTKSIRLRSVPASLYYYLGNKYRNKIWKNPFIVCKIIKYVWPWVLIFGIAFLSLNYCSYPSVHQFVKEIEVMLGPTLLAIFSVLQKSTSWLHLITASKLFELEHCVCSQIEDLEK